MTSSYRLALALVLFTGALGSGSAQDATAPPRQQIRIGFVEIENDPRYEPIRAYERIVLKTRDPPFIGAVVGIDEAGALARVLKVDFKLERITAKSRSRDSGSRACGTRWRYAFFPDRRAGRRIQAARRGCCAGAMRCCSTSPNRTMRYAATYARRNSSTSIRAAPSLWTGLLQFVVSRKWRDILVLRRPRRRRCGDDSGASRIRRKNSARGSSPHQHFKPGHRPARPRAKRSGAAERHQPRFRCGLSSPTTPSISPAPCPITWPAPRPVVGSIDLEPVAWHWTWERNGAPQVEFAFRQEVRRPAHGRRRLGGVDGGQDDRAIGAAQRTRPNSQSCALSSSATAVSTATRGWR